MMSWGRTEGRAARLVKDLDIEDLREQIDHLSNYAQDLSHSVRRSAGHQFGRARDYAADAAHEAEEIMKDNLAASLVLALALGLVVGYFLRRSAE